jgi:hypothetical protein
MLPMKKGPHPSYWHVLMACILGCACEVMRGCCSQNALQQNADYHQSTAAALDLFSSLQRHRREEQNSINPPPQGELLEAIIFPSSSLQEDDEEQRQITLFQIPSQEIPLAESSEDDLPEPAAFRLRSGAVHLPHQELTKDQLYSGRQQDFGGLILNLTFGIQPGGGATTEPSSPYVPEYYHIDGSKHYTKYRQKEDCVDTNWEHESKPVCNHLHERLIQDDAEFDISFLGAGAWRSTYGFQKKAADGTAQLDEWSFALKILRDSEWLPHGSDRIDYDMKKEANIMDRLSSSPRIVDIYAYCGTAMIAEHMKARIRHRIYTYPGLIAQEELDLIQAANDNQVVPQNNLTSMEKLDMAIDMAESVVTLHGYPAGMIIHFDLHTSQFLLSIRGSGHPLWMRVSIVNTPSVRFMKCSVSLHTHL